MGIYAQEFLHMRAREIDRAEPDYSNPMFQHEAGQRHYKKHRAVRALMRIFKNKEDAAHYAFREHMRLLKADKWEECQFWGDVSLEITGFNVSTCWMDNTHVN